MYSHYHWLFYCQNVGDALYTLLFRQVYLHVNYYKSNTKCIWKTKLQPKINLRIKYYIFIWSPSMSFLLILNNMSTCDSIPFSFFIWLQHVLIWYNFNLTNTRTCLKFLLSLIIHLWNVPHLICCYIRLSNIFLPLFCSLFNAL